MVYDNGEGTVSTIVCNWFGAGSAKLADADNDSSVQTYENIYDVNWLQKGNKMVMPGVERVDTIKTDDGYEMKSIWCRDDIRDTSMMKLSTATGYIYGYVQDLDSGMWQFIMIDFETGETAFSMDVSDNRDITIWQSVCMQEAVEMHYTVQPDILNSSDCRIGSYIFRKCLTEK